MLLRVNSLTCVRIHDKVTNSLQTQANKYYDVLRTRKNTNTPTHTHSLLYLIAFLVDQDPLPIELGLDGERSPFHQLHHRFPVRVGAEHGFHRLEELDLLQLRLE